MGISERNLYLIVIAIVAVAVIVYLFTRNSDTNSTRTCRTDEQCPGTQVCSGGKCIAGTSGCVTNSLAKESDQTFKTLTNLPFTEQTSYEVWGVRLQSSGKIVTFAYDDFNSTSTLFRFNPDGRLDPTFGMQGRLRLDDDNTDYMYISSDDSIFLAGYVNNNSIIRKFSKNGLLDTKFKFFDLADDPFSTRQGTLVADPQSKYLYSMLVSDNTGLTVVRKHSLATGDVDTNFGSSGMLTGFQYNSNYNGNRLTYHDGYLYVATYGQSPYRIAVQRYSSVDGTLDTDWGVAGTSILAMPASPVVDYFYPAGIEVDHSNGNVYVWITDLNFPATNVRGEAVFRLKPDGTLDSTWGVAGIASFKFLSNNFGPFMYEFIVQCDGSVVAGGYVYDDATPGGDRASLMTFDANGANGRYINYDSPNRNSNIYSLCQNVHGTIYTGGDNSENTNNNVAELMKIPAH